MRATKLEGGGVDSKKCSLSGSDKSGCIHFSKRDFLFKFQDVFENEKNT